MVHNQIWMMCVNHGGSEFLYCNLPIKTNLHWHVSLINSRVAILVWRIYTSSVVLKKYDCKRPISLVPFTRPIWLSWNYITILCIYKLFPCIYKLFSSIYKSFSCICKCSIYNYYMPTAHSLLWLVRSWSHGHLTKLILGCNITFKYSDSQQVRFVCSILNLNFWRGTQQKWIETRNSEEFWLLVKSWLGKENWENAF